MCCLGLRLATWHPVACVRAKLLADSSPRALSRPYELAFPPASVPRGVVLTALNYLKESRVESQRPAGPSPRAELRKVFSLAAKAASHMSQAIVGRMAARVRVKHHRR